MTTEQRSKLRELVFKSVVEDVRANPDVWADWWVASMDDSQLIEHFDLDGEGPASEKETQRIIEQLGFDPRKL